MAKVFKILQEHAFTETTSGIKIQYSNFSTSINARKRRIDSSSQIHNITFNPEYDTMINIPLQRNDMKKPHSMDLKYKTTNMKLNSNFMKGAFPTDSYTKGFQKQRFSKRYRFRRFNKYVDGYKKNWWQTSEHPYDPENNTVWIPFKPSAKDLTDPRNSNETRNGLDSKFGDSLLKQHRKVSSRNPVLQSFDCQQSVKSGPIERSDKLQKYSRNRTTSVPKNGKPSISKLKINKVNPRKMSTNPFKENEGTEIISDLQDIIGNVKFSFDIPPPAECKFMCVNRLLENRPSGFNISPEDQADINKIKLQNEAFKIQKMN
ncbi:hypothetical protein HNY73_009811 [Argiope bruennichi]|uniref:Uncharacterized protein n=1 Tax=Argiope bruennichi TaxID=94029 RepID=A0A8T0FDF9_ARGBR|nr:hypothetical protein HNY73_009811 [Argiope bruennichi]